MFVLKLKHAVLSTGALLQNKIVHRKKVRYTMCTDVDIDVLECLYASGLNYARLIRKKTRVSRTVVLQSCSGSYYSCHCAFSQAVIGTFQDADSD